MTAFFGVNDGSANQGYWRGTLDWDGATLTATTLSAYYPGNVTAITFVHVAGYVLARITSAVAETLNGQIDFDGDYWID